MINKKSELERIIGKQSHEIFNLKKKLSMAEDWLIAFSGYENVQPDWLKQSAKSLINQINEVKP